MINILSLVIMWSKHNDIYKFYHNNNINIYIAIRWWIIIDNDSHLFFDNNYNDLFIAIFIKSVIKIKWIL